jgi:hypothetical protein
MASRQALSLLEARGTMESRGAGGLAMDDAEIALLRERANRADAPEWLRGLLEEIERTRARLDDLERENRALHEQLSFYRRRVAA